MENKIVKNAGWIIGCKIIQSILNLIIGSLTARYLGPSNYGIINFAASIVAFVTPIMQLGINLILVNELVNHPEEEGKILGTSLTLNSISAIISSGLVFGFVALTKAGESFTQLVCVLYSIVLLAQAMEMIAYWYQFKLKSKYVSIVSIFSYLAVSAYKIFLLITEKNIAWFAISQTIDYLIIAVVLMVLYRKLGGRKYEFSFAVAKRILSRGAPYIISSLMIVSFVQLDKVFLDYFLDSTQVGIYSAALVCSGIATFVFTAILDSARPSIFEAKKIDKADCEHKIKLLFSIVVYLGLAQGLAFGLFAPLVINILYGSAYQGAINCLRILGWVTLFATIGSVRDIWILSEEKQKYLWIVNMSGAIFNIVGNIIVIPLWGIIGASVVALATQIFTNVITGFFIRPISYYNHILLRSLNPKNIYFAAKPYLGIIRSKMKHKK